MPIQLKRAYDPVEESDGLRVLVDRLWPRGVSKEQMHLDHWPKELTPSPELRKWFDHDPEKFSEFRVRYIKELGKVKETAQKLAQKASDQQVTLIYAAKDPKCNHALVLKEFLQELTDNNA